MVDGARSLHAPEVEGCAAVEGARGRVLGGGGVGTEYPVTKPEHGEGPAHGRPRQRA